MRYLKLYENFSESETACISYGINNYSINQDGSVDVDGDVELHDMNLYQLPIKFNKVGGLFNCRNLMLRTLSRSPKSIGEGFYCQNNELKSLKGCPEIINGSFFCFNNQLTTLEHGPKVVKDDYHCYSNRLINVVGFPKYFDHKVYINDNPVFNIIKLVNPDEEIKFIGWLNEYDVIRPGNKIVEQRLEEAYYMTTKTELSSELYKRTFKNYQLI